MDEFLESKLFGWLLLGMLAIGVGTSGMWRLPFSVEWHLFPTSVFWIEIVSVAAVMFLAGIIVVKILQSVKQAGRRGKIM